MSIEIANQVTNLIDPLIEKSGKLAVRTNVLTSLTRPDSREFWNAFLKICPPKTKIHGKIINHLPEFIRKTNENQNILLSLLNLHKVKCKEQPTETYLGKQREARIEELRKQTGEHLVNLMIGISKLAPDELSNIHEMLSSDNVLHIRASRYIAEHGHAALVLVSKAGEPGLNLLAQKQDIPFLARIISKSSEPEKLAERLCGMKMHEIRRANKAGTLV